MVEPKFFSYDTHDVYNLSKVLPGSTQGWSDDSLDRRRYVIADCPNHGFFAAVYLAEEGLILDGEQLDDGRLRLGDLALKEIIMPGHKFEIDIIDFEGDSGTLVLQHRMPNGQIQSNN